MKPIEALQRFKQPQMLADMDWNNRVEIIEKALKDYEKIKDIRITARFDLAQVNKEHKALEIIKGMSQIKVYYDRHLRKYMICFCDLVAFELPKSVYKLLKEILLNE